MREEREYEPVVRGGGGAAEKRRGNGGGGGHGIGRLGRRHGGEGEERGNEGSRVHLNLSSLRHRNVRTSDAIRLHPTVANNRT